MAQTPLPTTVIVDRTYRLIHRAKPTRKQAAALRYNQLVKTANAMAGADPLALRKDLMPIPPSRTFTRLTPKMSRKTARRMHTRNPKKLQKEIARELATYDSSQ